jgi:hypothetical protein
MKLKPCPFCGCNVVDYDVVVRHPATDLCILSNQTYHPKEWNCRVREDSLLRRLKEAVAEIEEQKADVFSDDQNKMECDDIWMNIGERNAYKLCVATLYEYFPELEAQDDTD